MMDTCALGGEGPVMSDSMGCKTPRYSSPVFGGPRGPGPAATAAVKYDCARECNLVSLLRHRKFLITVLHNIIQIRTISGFLRSLINFSIITQTVANDM